MAYAIADLRNIARLSARNAMDSTMYTNASIDYALQIAADQWQRVTKTPRALGTLTLTSGSAVLPTMPTNWTPDRTMQATLISPTGAVLNPELDCVSHGEVLRKQFERGSATAQGQPEMLGFSTLTSGIVYPVPDAAYLIYLWWWQPFTTWTAGGTPSPDSFNLSDEELRCIASMGAPAELQKSEPENAVRCQQMKDQFLTAAKQVKGRDAGGRGASVAFKDEPVVWSSTGGSPFYPVG
jgi:hypothetical protein